MNIGFISLGCAKNLVDSEIMMGILSKHHKIVNKVEKAELVIINTCGFILEAKEEAIGEILHTAELKKAGTLRYLLATGCLAQRYGQELLDEMPELDGVVGISSFTEIESIIARVAEGERILAINPPPKSFIEYGPRILSTPPGTAYLKIAEGCANRCSYCAIPLIRGHLRSRPIPDLVEEAHGLAEKGVRELVLIAQDTSAYGDDLQQEYDLSKLLSALNVIDGIEWIRVMYLHPARMDDHIIDAFASLDKVVPYMDIPIQHASTAILQNMNRRHDYDLLYNLFAKIRKEIPDVTLRTTVMLGFPGETDQDFQRLGSFIKEIQFDWLGAFAFQAEEGTKAFSMPEIVPDELKQERRDAIMRMQHQITRQKNVARVGQFERVLIGSAISRHLYRGRAAFQAPEVDGMVIIRSEEALKRGEFANVLFKGIRHYDMIGEAQA